MKLIHSLLILCFSTLCCASCSSIGKDSRENWATRGNFVNGSASQLEGIYNNTSEDDYRDLWRIIADEKDVGDAVLIELKPRDILEISLLESGKRISVVKRKLTKKGNYWSAGSPIKLHGVPPFAWGVSNNEVGLAVDRTGNLHSSFDISGAFFIGPIGMAGGDSIKRSAVHNRISPQSHTNPARSSNDH